MSRTYRRKNFNLVNNTSSDNICAKKYGKGNYTYDSYMFWGIYVELPIDKQIKQRIRTHTDNGCVSLKAPSWFNNMYERKLRRSNRNEIRKWMCNPEYEPMCSSTPKDTTWSYF